MGWSDTIDTAMKYLKEIVRLLGNIENKMNEISEKLDTANQIREEQTETLGKIKTTVEAIKKANIYPKHPDKN